MKNILEIVKKLLQILLLLLMKLIKVCKKGIHFLQSFFSKMRVLKKHQKRKLLSWINLSHLFLFSFLFLYDELLLRIFNGHFLSHIIYPILFSIAFGLLANAITSLFNRKMNRLLSIIIMITSAVLFITECLVKRTFQVYMPISALFTGAGGVTTNYTADVITTILNGLLVLALYFLPVILYILLGKKRLPAYQYKWPAAIMMCFLSLVIFGLSAGLASVGSTSSLYTNHYQFSSATETFGLLTSIRLSHTRDTSTLTVVEDTEQEETKQQEEEDFSQYDKNVMSLDLDALIQSDEGTYQEIDNYVNSLSASSQNKYTGIFEGKNLILICAEAFSDHAVSEELTPTLYRMIHNGFYFSDYYQLTWGGSTSSGEYSFLMGLVPNEGVDTILYTQDHNNYFTLPNQLQRLSYYTGAYHNSDYDYYDRNLTHQNLGFNYWLGQGNGIEDIAGDYPSDEEMFSATFDTYVNYQPFCMYYMTLMGHSPYSADSWKATSNWDYVTSIVGNQYSETVTSYLCYQYELEKAMATLVQKLEDAGIADDTVICLTADHYPYGLAEDAYGNGVDYVSELYGHSIDNHIDQDENALIIWSECLEEGGDLHEYQREISTPTYSLDIVPTLSNLFGLEFDSRLLVGRDVFSDATPMVVWNDYSWLTEKGYYSSYTGEFTSFVDEEVSQDYIDKMSTIAENKVNISDQILQTDYYAHLFGGDDIVDTTAMWQEKYGNKNTDDS